MKGRVVCEYKNSICELISKVVQLSCAVFILFFRAGRDRFEVVTSAATEKGQLK